MPTVVELAEIFLRSFSADSSSILLETIMSQGLHTSCLGGAQPVKLAELRAKTDQQLHDLVHSKLELGSTFAALVEEPCSGGNPDHAEQLLRRVEQAVIEVKELLPVLNEDQRRGFGPT